MRKKIVSIGLTVAALAGVGVYAWRNWDQAAALRLESPSALGLCALALVGTVLAVGPLFFITVNKLSRCVGLLECVWLAVLTTFVNTLVPLQGGAWVRAAYLKRRHGFDFSSFLATLYGYQILRVLVCAVGAAAAVAWMALVERRPGLGLLLAGVLLCLGAAVAACCLPRVSPRGRWLVDRLATFTQGWHALRAEPKFLATMAALVAAQLAAEVLAFWAACAALGARLGLSETVAITTLSILVTVLGLTPSGLGLYEAMATFIGGVVALGDVPSFWAVWLARFVLVGVLAALAPPAIYGLARAWRGRAPAPPPEPAPSSLPSFAPLAGRCAAASPRDGSG
jgi:uncharacterized membrane protein YbhN (UPF0104 family)